MAYLTDSFDDEIVRRLKAGQVGLLPTDTIYGLSCRALDRGAVERLHRLKERDAHKPFIVLISDLEMLELLGIFKDQAKAVEKYWPGPVSAILESDSIPDWLQLGSDSLAVRMPNHAELLNLIDKVGPIVSTSANLQGGAPARSAADAKDLFGEQLDFYLEAGQLDNLPSTLVIVENGKLKVVRPGAVKIS